MASSGWAFVLQYMESPPLVGNIPAPSGAALPNRAHELPKMTELGLFIWASDRQGGRTDIRTFQSYLALPV